MSAKTLFPSLDTDGWVQTSTKVADYLISHFFLTDYSQTAFFENNVASFAYILQTNQNNLAQTVQTTREKLSQYFSEYFHDVEIEVDHSQQDESINNHNLLLYISFKDQEGVEYNLSRVIKYAGMKVTDIVAVINNG